MNRGIKYVPYRGKIVLITDASAGIVQQNVVDYAEACDIKLTITPRRLEKLEIELKSKYPKKDFKDIDISINNPRKALGVDKIGNFNLEDIDEIFQVKVIGMIAID
ncbi:hypothetical protein WICMUC_005029 [Wickerhamomyces mucosus]|uniref:Uncharacterized protein n=1 Tax=Wickerhamomyces mucosus TaxID=1378264 RepID=A0A9P8PCQ6_9ASCO|nr:hypothetical protein WICMUC_005029 [Wickerhamomyces mucosus]